MEKANTNGNGKIKVVGGLVVTDPEKSKTMIPPKTEVEIDSVEASEPGLEIKLEGEFPPREQDGSVRKSSDGSGR